ncbi:uncharacterized protein [Miscanthus floridulus]|uniref:uncharacterized protein n=1 Tax=Miscanthus floridulus TaxID=154761 RepID=UPI00345AFB60
MQHGAASARADAKEPAAQGEATEAATKQVGEEAPMPCEAGALELGEAKAPSVAEATEGEAEAPRTSEAEVVEARPSRASKAEVADARAPKTTEAEVAEAGLGMAKPVAQDAKTEARQASIAEVEDLHLHCVDMKAEAAMAWEQATPLAARIKELEEEPTRVADERDTFRSWVEQEAASAKAVVKQLEEEQGTHLLMKGALVEAIKVAEASQVEALA